MPESESGSLSVVHTVVAVELGLRFSYDHCQIAGVLPSKILATQCRKTRAINRVRA